MNFSEKVMELCRKHYADVVEIRRDIHMHPEIGFEVERTAGIAAAEMEKLGLKVRTGIGKTGVLADLDVPGATKRVALRADMDALPMQEMSNPPYKSLFDGKAHMCGHDSHTAMLIGAARILVAMKDQLKTNIRFVFQPNEENLPGGAPAMIADGAMEGIDEVFGLHVWPQTETGKISVCEGPALAQPDTFEITIKGIGGHAAVPHAAVDPIVIGSQFVTAAQSIVARSVDPLKSAVLSVTQFHAGTTHNVIPESAYLMGTVRTFNKEIKEMVRDRLEGLLKALTETNGATYTFDYTDGYPVCFNNAESVQKVLTASAEVVGQDNLIYPEIPVMGGEDFAYFSEVVPGCFLFLGTRNEEKGTIYMCHDPRFDIDEDCMIFGMAVHATLALNYS